VITRFFNLRIIFSFLRILQYYDREGGLPMCLAVPGEVVTMENGRGEVDFLGVKRLVDLRLVEGVKIGDYVLVHAGCAIQVIPPEEARETQKLFEEMMHAE
jgi:hydrogenase expression/formation protein HypC